MSRNTPCGIAIPQVFSGGVDEAAVRRFVVRAEELGFDSLWVQESIVSRIDVLEPIALLSYVAALTKRVRLGVAVMLLTLRNPVQLAKSLATLDRLSNGRVDPGIGIGGHVPEEIFGYSRDGRVRRFEEAIEVIKALWTQERATASGRFWNFQNVAMEPKPVQHPHPPLWFGARQPPALRRTVKYGDGFMGAGSSTFDDFVMQYNLLRQYLDEAGRDPASLRISKRVYLAVDADRAQAEERLREWFGSYYNRAEMASAVSVWGSPQECVDKLSRFVEAGAQHLMLNPVFDEHAQLEVLAEEVVPHL